MRGIWLAMVWVAPLITFLLVNETRFKKNIVIGVTLPFDARKDTQVLEALGKFKKWECIACALLIVLAGLGWAFHVSSMFLVLLWIDLCIVIPYIPYWRTNTALKAVKREKRWGQVAGQHKIRVNTDAIPKEKWVSAWAFLPSVLLCLVPLAFDRTLWGINLTMAVSCGLFWLGYRYCYRNKSEMVDDNVEVTQILTRARRKTWANMWLLCAYGMAVLTLAMAFTSYSVVWSMVVTVIFTVVLVSASLWMEMGIRKLQETLTAESGQQWYVDEDEHWIGGILYYNKDDSRLIINNRVGMNSSVNAAHPVGKVLIVILVLMLVLLPFTSYFMGGTSFELGYEEQELYSIYGRTEYRIDIDDMVSVELLEELPRMTRNVGTGLPNLLQGKFTGEGIGRMRICLNPEQPPFLLIETAEDGIYLLGGTQEGEVEAIYDQIKR